ncbi:MULTISPECIES: hypothetical protein [unclassified Mesorhizobium]|nr:MULTISPECIES: hypothetical protein [unclassified Mesorhizobium]
MTSEHRLWAIFWIAFFVSIVAVRIASHDGCLAFCTNIASSGAN